MNHSYSWIKKVLIFQLFLPPASLLEIFAISNYGSDFVIKKKEKLKGYYESIFKCKLPTHHCCLPALSELSGDQMAKISRDRSKIEWQTKVANSPAISEGCSAITQLLHLAQKNPRPTGQEIRTRILPFALQ